MGAGTHLSYLCCSLWENYVSMLESLPCNHLKHYEGLLYVEVDVFLFMNLNIILIVDAMLIMVYGNYCLLIVPTSSPVTSKISLSVF